MGNEKQEGVMRGSLTRRKVITPGPDKRASRSRDPDRLHPVGENTHLAELVLRLSKMLEFMQGQTELRDQQQQHGDAQPSGDIARGMYRGNDQSALQPIQFGISVQRFLPRRNGGFLTIRIV